MKLRTRFLIGFALLISTIPAHAYTDDQAVKAIIGEAEDQGQRGMLAVACAIRNRGTLKGVFGLHAPRVRRHLYSQRVKDEAVSAWDISGQDGMIALNNYEQVNVCGFVRGAKNWENTKAFGLPYWAKGMQVVFTYKDHKFFK